MQQAILSGLQALDNSIVMQLADGDNAAGDVSFVQCFYGHQRSHVEAAKKALLLNLGSEPKFCEWIFTEAQVDGEREFEWLRDYGVKYEFVPIPDESKWMFLKWPLWNLGLKKASNGKLAFADADVVFCGARWAAEMSKALDEFDVVSLSRKCYYAEQSFKGRDAGLGSYKGVLDTAGASEHGHAGFTFGFTGKFLSEFGRFGCSIQKHGDVESWKRARKIAKAKGFKVGCAKGMCCHVSHGFLSDRRYEESKDVFREMGEDPGSFVVYGPEDVLPRWNGENSRCREVRDEFAFLYFDQFCPKGGPFVLDKGLSPEQVRDAVQKKIDDSVEDGTNFVEPIVQDADPEDVDDVAVVQCLFGTDPEQVAAAKKATDMLVRSGQRPIDWVFAEAQRGGESAQMADFCRERGIRYMFVKVSERSDGVFLKHALWSAAARGTSAPKILFVDADVAFYNARWLANVSEALDGFQVVQPFSEIWMSEELKSSDDAVYFKAGFRTSFAKALSEGGATYRRHVPGYGLAMTRDFFERIGQRIDVLPSNGSDAWFWYRHLPAGAVVKSDLYLPLTAKDYSGDLRPGEVSYAGNIAFHVRHGTRSGRKYEDTVYFNKVFCDEVNDTLEYDGDVPVFKDTPTAKAHQRCVLECRASDERPDEIFRRAALRLYGDVRSGNEAVVMTVLNNESGVVKEGRRETITHDLVRAHKALVDRYCESPHRYVCVTNEKIDGVETIPFRLDPAKDIMGWECQVELFRAACDKKFGILGHPVLTIDFDCVPTRRFGLFDAPDGTFSMMRQVGNAAENVSPVVYNIGTMYFKGDFGFIFDNYAKLVDRGIPSSMYYTTLQDFVAYEALRNGYVVQNVLKYVDVLLLKLGVPQYRRLYGQAADHDFVHYLGTVKPWNRDKVLKLKLRHLVPDEMFDL